MYWFETSWLFLKYCPCQSTAQRTPTARANVSEIWYAGRVFLLCSAEGLWVKPTNYSECLLDIEIPGDRGDIPAIVAYLYFRYYFLTIYHYHSSFAFLIIIIIHYFIFLDLHHSIFSLSVFSFLFLIGCLVIFCSFRLTQQ